MVGTVRLVEDNESEHSYTGLLQKADFGILRLSESHATIADPEFPDKFSPAAAIKFFVDGKKSMNLITASHFDGIEDPYFFAEPFRTHPPRGTNECAQNTIEKKFAEAT